MAKAVYLGVGGTAHKVSKAYIGVSGAARQVKKIYIGAGGQAKLCYSEEQEQKLAEFREKEGISEVDAEEDAPE